MILGDPGKWDAYAEAGVYGERTLDQLLHRTAGECGDEPALSWQDPAGTPCSLTWSELDARAGRLADFLLDLGVKQDDPVIVLAGASAEAMTALFALSRAGMIAVPLSPLTGAREVAGIAETLGARAIIAEGMVGPRDLAEVAALAAFSAFDIRFLLGFGEGLPDGVIGLDEVIAGSEMPASTGAVRGGRASDHVFVVTADGGGQTLSFPARNHGQLIAAALPLVAYGGFAKESVIATPMIPSSLSGLAIVAAWVISRARLHCLPAWESEGIAQAAVAADATHLAVSGRLDAAMDPVGGDITLVRMWRDTIDPPPRGHPSAIDTVSLGEAALMVYRGGETRANIIPLYGLRLDGDRGPPTLEPRIQGIVHKAENAVEPGTLMRGPLCVRGPGTPVMAFSKDETGKARFPDNGFMLTGLRGELVEADGPAVRVLGPIGHSARTGHIAMDLDEIDTIYAGIEGIGDAAALALPHPLLGHVPAMAYVAAADLDIDDVNAQLSALGVSAYKLPVSLLRVDSIPRDGNGTVRRSEIGKDTPGIRTAVA